MKNWDDYYIGFLLILSGFSFAAGYHFFIQRGILGGYTMMLFAWASYFTAHYIENGCFVDGMSSGGFQFNISGNRFKSLLGVVIILSGLSIFTLGIQAGELGISGLGSSIALLGYSFAHHVARGSLL